MWYAVMMDREDNDCGYGSNDLDEAKEMCQSQKAEHPDAYIAVIAAGEDPVCIDEIAVD